VCLGNSGCARHGHALLLDSDDPGFSILRGVMTLTLVIPPAITAMLFLLLQDAQFGMIPYGLRVVGLLTAATPFSPRQTLHCGA
jgi:multiple sugar transport system permease protein